MKIFWWGDVDDLYAQLPTLHFTQPETMTVMVEYGDKAGKLEELIGAGYIEVSRRTAFTMGMPA